MIARLDEGPRKGKPGELVGADGLLPEPDEEVNSAPSVSDELLNGPWRRTLVLPDRSGHLRLTEVDPEHRQTA